MSYTHTVEIIVNGINIVGELSFDGGTPPKLSTESDLDIKLDDLKAVHTLLDSIVTLYEGCGVIEKIEVVKK